MSRVVEGVVQNGVVVFKSPTKLQDGMLVHVVVFDDPVEGDLEQLTPEEREDLAASLAESERGEYITGEESIRQLRELEASYRRR